MSKCEICGRELGLNEDHRDCVIKDYAKCIEDLEHTQNQKAIECLKEVEEDLLDISNGYWKCFAKNGQQYMTSDDLEECLKEYIDNKIKELEGE